MGGFKACGKCGSVTGGCRRCSAQLRQALKQCVRELELWHNIAEREGRGGVAQLTAAIEAAHAALSAYGEGE